MATNDGAEDLTLDSRGTTSSEHVDALKFATGNDGSWNEPKTTALAAIALYSTGMDAIEIWQNSNNIYVSLANAGYPNAMASLINYIEDPAWKTADNNIDIEAFTLSVMAVTALDPAYDLTDAFVMLKTDQNTVTGSWNNDVLQTAIASYTISVADESDDNAVDSAVGFLRSKETELEWATVMESSLSVLALSAAGMDVSGELKQLITNAEPDGSFGTIEPTAWAVAALSMDITGNSMEYAGDAQVWLASVDTITMSPSELALSVMGESISLGEDIPPPDDDDGRFNSTDQENDGNTSFDNNKYNETVDELPLFFQPPAEPEKSGDGGHDDLSNEDTAKSVTPSSFFSKDNLLWVIVAVVSILFIVSLATWGLIARIEEGKALEGVRRDIVEYIRHNPGEHFAGIMHEFDMSPSSTTYHLKVLEDTEQVVAHKDNKYKRYYLAGNTIPLQTQSRDYKELMSVLKNATSRKIVWHLLANQGSSQKQVAEALGIHPSTVNWHANRLKEIGILEKLKKGKEVAYTIVKEDSVRSVMAIIEEGT